MNIENRQHQLSLKTRQNGSQHLLGRGQRQWPGVSGRMEEDQGRHLHPKPEAIFEQRSALPSPSQYSTTRYLTTGSSKLHPLRVTRWDWKLGKKLIMALEPSFFFFLPKQVKKFVIRHSFCSSCGLPWFQSNKKLPHTRPSFHLELKKFNFQSYSMIC